MGQRNYTPDAELYLADGAAAYTSSDIGQVAAADAIIDTGPGGGRFEGVAVVDVDAIKISANDELYHLIIMGSTAADLSSGKQILGMISLGATEVRPGGAIDSVIGRYEIPFQNEQDDVRYRYLALYVAIDAGSTSPSIDLRARAHVKY